MARQRTIAPAFWTSEQVVACSFAARLLFIGLWTEADREGRLEDKPLPLKMRLFAADAVDVEGLLGELTAQGLVERYQVAGRRLLTIPGFARHQHVHPKEAPSKLPPPGEARESVASMAPVPMPAPVAATAVATMRQKPGLLPHAEGVNQSAVQAFRPSAVQAFKPSAVAPGNPGAPSSPEDIVDGEGFFAWAQDFRTLQGWVRERPPPRGVGAWFSHAMMESAGSQARLCAAFEAFARDAHWAPKRAPWSGWLAQWERFVPTAMPEVAAVPACAACGQPGPCGWPDIGAPMCREHHFEATEWAADHQLQAWVDGAGAWLASRKAGAA